MKKVAFITRHAVANYGSALQTYATEQALKKIGCNSVCINYIATDELPKNITKSRLKTSRMNTSALKRLAFMLIQKPVYLHSCKKFRGYIKDLVNLTDTEYHTTEELKANLPDADIFMTGSDQVWNLIFDDIDENYFLPFVPDGKKKIAYAGCFGGDSIKESDTERIGNMLRRYDHITVRESSGVDICKKLSVEAQQVVDPTLLLTPSEWNELIPKRENKEKYVLVYQLQPNKEFEIYAKEFAKRKGLKLYRVNPYFTHAVKSGRFICCPKVEDFVWYVKNAEYFLTDSFHGTCFALSFNTQFVDILPNKNNERIFSLLKLAGIENKILQSYDDFSIADEPIDFVKVNPVLDTERQKSFELLKKMVND